MEKLLKELRNWMTLKNYSESTIRCYVSAVKNFAVYCREHQSDPDYSKAKAPEQYLLYRFKSKHSMNPMLPNRYPGPTFA